MNNNKAIKVISIFCVLGIIILMFIFFSEIYKEIALSQLREEEL